VRGKKALVRGGETCERGVSFQPWMNMRGRRKVPPIKRRKEDKLNIWKNTGYSHNVFLRGSFFRPRLKGQKRGRDY